MSLDNDNAQLNGSDLEPTLLDDPFDKAIDCAAQTRVTAQISISLAYAPTPTEQVYTTALVATGTTILEALQQVGWLQTYPELARWCDTHRFDTEVDNKDWRIGVFSVKRPLNFGLQAQDRVEVYRPLTMDPMRKRKKRAIK